MGFDVSAGWTEIRSLLAEDEVAETLAGCAELLDLPADQRRARDKPHSGTRHLCDVDERLPIVAETVSRPALIAVVTEILGSAFRLNDVGYRSPQPSFGGQKLHADDLPRTASSPPSVATAIIALTDFTADNGATRLVPGSHLRPDLQRMAGTLEDHPDELVLTSPAGTAFVFDGHVLHSGTTNRSTAERPALQLIWRTA